MNLLDPVPELNTLDDLRQPARPRRDPPPFPFGRHHQLEDHDQGGLAAQVAPGVPGSVSDRREVALIGNGGGDVLPVLAGEVMEAQELVPVPGQLFGGLFAIDAVDLRDQVERGVGFLPGFRHPVVVKVGLGTVMQVLWHRPGRVRGVAHPAALLPGLRMHVPQGRPEAESAIADGKLGRRQSACLEARLQVPPAAQQFPRNPSMTASTSFSPQSSAPISTGMHWCRWRKITAGFR